MTVAHVEETRQAWDAIAAGYGQYVAPTEIWLANEALRRARLRPGDQGSATRLLAGPLPGLDESPRTTRAEVISTDHAAPAQSFQPSHSARGSGTPYELVGIPDIAVPPPVRTGSGSKGLISARPDALRRAPLAIPRRIRRPAAGTKPAQGVAGFDRPASASAAASTARRTRSQVPQRQIDEAKAASTSSGVGSGSRASRATADRIIPD